MVGTPRCGVPARQGGTKGCERPHVCAVPVPSPDAALGDGDGAARHPYQKPDGARRHLPFETGALAVCEIYKWPIFGAGDEFFANRILQDIIGLLTPAFVIPQPVLEEIALPVNADLLGGPFLPFADDGLQGLARRRKGHQRMKVVRHQEKNVRPPQTFLLPMPDGVQQPHGNIRQRKLVPLAGTSRCDVRTAQRAIPTKTRTAQRAVPTKTRTAVPTILATHPAIDRDKINFLARINPQRDFMRQGFSARQIHAGKIARNLSSGQIKLW